MGIIDVINNANNPGGATPAESSAPTGAEVAAYPGKYAGTSFDPIAQNVPLIVTRRDLLDDDGNKRIFATKNYSGPLNWASWYRFDPVGADRYFEHEYGSRLNYEKLAEIQRIAMGLD